MELLERDSDLDALASALAVVLEGRGLFVAVTGEAGVGKTALLHAFSDQHGRSARVLWGSCDPLETPRPLGAFVDIAHRIGGDLQRAVLRSDREATFSALLRELEQADTATVLIVEDVHWADAATLDLLKLLGRRLRSLQCLLVVSCRDDEIGRQEALGPVLGNLNVDDIRQVRLSPLSEVAVTTLVERAGRVVKDLYSTSGGNPLYVTEILRTETEGMPPSLADAILARVLRLPAEIRGVAELCAVVPARVEFELIDALGVDPDGFDGCLEAGLLCHQVGGVAFRHELARRAVEESIPPNRRRQLHRRVLEALNALQPRSGFLARLAYHAEQAGEANAVLEYGPAAADQASRFGCHREAAAHYQAALRYADRLDPAHRADLLERTSYEWYLCDRLDHALQAQRSALEIWQSLEDPVRIGGNLTWTSRLLWMSGDGNQARRYGRQAVETLAQLPPSTEVAKAYSNLSNLHMLAQETAAAVEWGLRAIELARQLDEPEVLAHALNNVGTAEWMSGDDSGRSMLEESLDISLELKLQEHAKRAYTNLGSTALSLRDYRRAARYLDEGIEYCVQHDLRVCQIYLRGSRARIRFDQGEWAVALEEALAVLDDPTTPALLRIPAQVVVARIRTRRGEPDASTILGEAREVAATSQELQWMAPVAAALSEAAWLTGRHADVAKEAGPGYELAQERGDAWAIGELGLWLWRAGEISDPPTAAANPYLLQITGDWRAAAAAWEQLGCPYEQAEAMADSDQESALRAALGIYDGLDAKPAATALRRRMRANGMKTGTRGPRPSTTANPARLTNRELEVLRLLTEGFRNSQIAERLYISPKTVEHHVSAVLVKLGVPSRAEVPVTAIRMGIVPAQDEGTVVPT